MKFYDPKSSEAVTPR